MALAGCHFCPNELALILWLFQQKEKQLNVELAVLSYRTMKRREHRPYVTLATLATHHANGTIPLL